MQAGFVRLQTERKRFGLNSKATAIALRSLIGTSLSFLNDSCQKTPVAGPETGKRYYRFSANNKNSRPINDGLFDISSARRFLSESDSIIDLKSLELDERSRVLYTISMTYCAATDLTKERDQKTPGTFFEILIGHIFSVLYDVEPKKRLRCLTSIRNSPCRRTTYSTWG
jgi:hypothetical protein